MPLAERFLIEVGVAAGRPAPSLGADAAARLRAHPWPGNVRELKNVIVRSALFCKMPVLDAGALRMGAMDGAADAKSVAPSASAHPAAAAPAPAGMSPERAERRRRAIGALEKTVWNQTRAAELLGVTRRTLQTWMIDLDIPRPRAPGR